MADWKRMRGQREREREREFQLLNKFKKNYNYFDNDDVYWNYIGHVQ